MTPVLAVLQLSDSFADQWARLAATAGASVRCGRSLAGLGSLDDACGLELMRNVVELYGKVRAAAQP